MGEYIPSGELDLKEEDYIQARDKYKPSKVKYLLIAESPPASGGYFYFEETTGQDSLFNATMKALDIYPENKTMPKGLDKKRMLTKFQARGFFLVDVSYKPVNDKKIPKEERQDLINKGIPELVNKVSELDPECIIIIKKGKKGEFFKRVRTALENEGFGGKILNKGAVPFPGSGNQSDYRRILRMLIARGAT
jgi:hypothetical protein